MDNEIIKVLLVEDDEDDFILTRDLFSQMPGNPFKVDWAKTFQSGLETILLHQHDVCLVDYRLGPHNGVEFVQAALQGGCQAPMILLTGAGAHQVDVQAMQAGASDYLVKSEIRADPLERSIRYALERKRAAANAAFEQARLAAFGAQVGLVLTRSDPLDSLLHQCATAMVQFLNAAGAEISTYDAEKMAFEPHATAGPVGEHLSRPGRLPEVRLELSPLVEGKPVLIKQLLNDSHLADQEWAKREGLVSYAAYPLLLEDKLVGLMSLFTQHQLTEGIWQELGSVASGIALGIERKRSEEALTRSEVKYRSVVESVREVIFQLDAFGHWDFLNPAWTAVTGFEVAPTLGTFFLEYIASEDQEHNRHIFLKLMERSLDYCRYETRLLHKSGKIRWVEVYLQPTIDEHGAVLGLSGTLGDITDRKAAELQIQKLAAFPKLNPNPVLEFSTDGALTYANDAAQEMVKALRKDDLPSILPPSANEIARDCFVSGQKKLRQEVSLNNRILNWSFFPIASSNVVHCYGADVTEIQNLEAQLRHAQKLESVGQLAAGVAHDFNNILTVIQGYAECLLVRCQEDRTTCNALKQVSLAAQRAAGLTRQLLLFSRKQLIQPKPLDLNAVLANLTNMLGRLVGEHISIEPQYAPDLPAIEADTGMLEQVVINLAVNSRDAMPKGGKLIIATAPASIDQVYANSHADAKVGPAVCLSLSDTGCGMDARTLERIFEPFFTTKEVGKGTGLGLATVYGIVKQHGGWIEVTSKLGRGTTFKIFLPATNRPAASLGDTGTTAEAARGGPETILLVEDDAVLREFVREVLAQYQYNVIEAPSGTAALQVWDKHSGKIDLLLTDMVMPDGMSGRDLALELKKRNPALKIIYTSGYSPEMMGEDGDRAGAPFLPKPYNPQQLAQLVRQCLDSAAPIAPQPAPVACATA